MLKLCLGILVDTLLCVKWLARLSIFIHADILVLVSEFVVVVFLSEWWSVPTTADHCGHINYQHIYVKLLSKVSCRTVFGNTKFKYYFSCWPLFLNSTILMKKLDVLPSKNQAFHA